ncbi:MAG: DNA-protecting protein DprA, partial [Candidatus Nealsonbacteria bacterium CG_4_10_14_0_2_um_filter_39_15]
MLDLKNVQGIKEITTQDENYPRSLREIKDAPEVLYSKGELKAEEKCFAIVGARRCSDYGKQIALEIAGDLAEAGLTIVSGLAPGIDTIAHQATLERKGKTIAVLGTGIDEESIYPQSNLKLAEKILESGGALVSEYPPGTRGTQFTFPQRNRIISGLSLGVLVVEAKQKSGALITADWARKQRRLVFAIPGSIYFSNSKGCNNLIKNGAKLAESADDILKELNLQKSDFCIKKTSGETSEENLILNA